MTGSKTNSIFGSALTLCTKGAERNNAMAKDKGRNVRPAEEKASDEEEARSLLSSGSDERHGVDDHPPNSSQPRPSPRHSRRHSSLAQARPSGTPRTPNRVRFEVEDGSAAGTQPNGHADQLWVEDEDYMSGEGDGRRSTSESQRLPLLTGIEAPSITVASADSSFNVDDLLESSRPKSGMANAFMNMANSIM